jgi:ADP-heptose:LPS heptosyltransferase
MFYSRLLPVRSDIAVAEHEREALRAAGLPVSLSFPTLEFVRNASVLTKFSLERGKFVIVHFFAGGAGRSTSIKKSRELLIALRKTLPKDISLVVSGASADRESANAISHGMEVKVIAGDATLQEMMNLIMKSRAVVSVDTGVAHITAQLGKPLVVMRSCLGRNWWFPAQYGKDALITVFSCDNICAGGHFAKDYSDCINAIDMADVASRTTILLGKA